MKVVLFCGGLGLRMRASEDSAPKPMMPIGDRPVLWHIMRYYSHFGHNEFILCLGHGARSVKDYFLNYEETASNDFVLSKGGDQIELLDADISDWRITFVDTGIETPIGERLRRVRQYLDDDHMFLANYGDVLTDAPIDDMVHRLRESDDVATMLAIKPQESFHVVSMNDKARVDGFVPVVDMDIRINGGYFVLRKEIFDFLNEGEDLVMDACTSAAAAGRVQAYPYDGFWAPMDTLKERAVLEQLYRSGNCPWMPWRSKSTAEGTANSGLEVPSIRTEP
jgi:glucose-1-phosphate cytidylyltransferase